MSRTFLIQLVKRLLFVVVVAAVVWQGAKYWKAIDWSGVRVRPSWLLASAVCYLAGWLPAVWYWRRLLADGGSPTGWLLVSRAYYCGHLGKYVPGKALVPVIRASMLRRVPPSVPVQLGVATAIYESLASMAAAGMIGAALAPFLLTPEFIARWWPGLGNYQSWLYLFPAVALVAAVVGLPVLSRVINLLVRKTTPRSLQEAGPPPLIRTPRWEFVVLMAGWWLHGLSLGCTILAVTDISWDWGDWPRWTAAASLATVLGFVVLFAPGGLGVREGVLLELLEPEIGPRAVLVAALLRVVWLCSELIAASVLYFGVAAGGTPPEQSPD